MCMSSPYALYMWGCRRFLGDGKALPKSDKLNTQLNDLESSAKEGESPVNETCLALWGNVLSTTGHEKPCGNLGGPPSKAKYSLMTDSEQVP